MDTDWTTWHTAMERALYGPPATDSPGGFFVRESPAAHFRTSVHASPLFAGAVARLLRRVDGALGRPARLALVDVGAGRGELLSGVLAVLPADVAARVRPYGVERAGRPEGLDPRIGWGPGPPSGVTGLLFANEWLDNVPLDVAETGPDGVPRSVLVRADGTEQSGGPLSLRDTEWLERWWPLGSGEPGLRAEIGRPRDEAWASAVASLERGVAVAVDYAHTRADRPPFGTLTGYRDGREVGPVPDGSRDITAHVALDACAAAGAEAAGRPTTDRTAAGATATGRAAAEGGEPAGADTDPAASTRLVTQRAALRALGVDGGRPPLSLASSDPAAYVKALSSCGEAAELTDSGGLGSFSWLMQSTGGCPLPDLTTRTTAPA